MIVGKIFVNYDNADKKQIVFMADRQLDNYCCSPAGTWFNKFTGTNGFRYSSTIIGYDNIAISQEAIEALLTNLTSNFNRKRYSRNGQFGIYQTSIDVPGEAQKQISITWKPENAKESCDLSIDIDSQCAVDISKGFSPELLTKITKVMDNNYLKQASFKDLNSSCHTIAD